MPAETDRPVCYAAPLTDQEHIIGFLIDHDSYYRGYHDSCPLAWNVKVYNLDLSPDHLIDVFKESGECGPENQWIDFPEWREPAFAKHAEIGESQLCEWAIGDARESVTGTDCYRCLWKGDYLDAEYGFYGRSGGWLCLTRFEGTRLNRMDRTDFRDYLESLTDATLRNLYELVVQNDHNFLREAVKAEIELMAAFTWIENLCGDIPRPERTQSMLPIA